MCFSTVPSVTHSFRAIPLLERPSAISARTSRSLRRQHVEQIVRAAGRDKLGDESRVDHRGAPHQALQRIDEVVHVDDPALQQVTAALAAGQQTHGVLDLDMRGKDKDGDVRKFRTNLASRVKAFGGVTGRHPDVHDHQFRPLLAHKRQQQRRVCALPYDVEARPLEQARDSFAQQDVVVCQRDLDAILGHLYDYGICSGP